MSPKSLPPESRQHLGNPEGTVVVQYNHQKPLQALPKDVSETFIEEIALTGAIFRVIVGPGFTIRFIHEVKGVQREAEANLASLAGTQALTIALRWSADFIALDVMSAERPGVVARGRG